MCLGDTLFIRNNLLCQECDIPAQCLSKHIKIRNFFVKERVDEGEITIRWLKTELMIADVLTKPLQGASFKVFTDLLTGEMVLDCLINLV